MEKQIEILQKEKKELESYLNNKQETTKNLQKQFNIFQKDIKKIENDLNNEKTFRISK